MKLPIAIRTAITCLSIACTLAPCTPQQPVATAAAPPAAPTPAEPRSMSRTPSPAGASVYFVEPQEGATVRSPVHVVFGISGMQVAAAGVEQPNTGHHHLIVDADLPSFDAPIPKDDHHLHYGNGQSDADVTLAPGPHTLQLLLGYHLHISDKPPLYSSPLKTTVVE